jgi:hypothetical protein
MTGPRQANAAEGSNVFAPIRVLTYPRNDALPVARRTMAAENAQRLAGAQTPTRTPHGQSTASAKRHPHLRRQIQLAVKVIKAARVKVKEEAKAIKVKVPKPRQLWTTRFLVLQSQSRLQPCPDLVLA